MDNHMNQLRFWPAMGLALGLALGASPSLAEAPMQKKQSPGYYRMMLGAFEVTALSDGTVKLPVRDLLTNTTPAKTDKALAKVSLVSPLETSVNGYLINTGSKLVLIDVGAAGLFGPTLGQLVNNLKASGYTPEQVDEIYITHMHPDHVGGLMAGNVPAFPNAVVRADKADADFWLSEAKLNAAPADAKGFFQGAQASLKAYQAAGKLKTFEANTELVPGIRAQASHGHTPGHNVFVVESQGQKLAIWGDLIHVAAVQFADPKITIKFDVESKAAMKERAKAFADAAKGGYLVAATHIAFPGIGRVRKEGAGYSWVPTNYTSGQ
jgi:glyoxylase-like metal-dependent hydrolase (beta-lactamase superfamily II)